MKKKFLHYFIPGSLTFMGLVIVTTVGYWGGALIGAGFLFAGGWFGMKKRIEAKK